jgi:hypothetical protein
MVAERTDQEANHTEGTCTDAKSLRTDKSNNM